MIARHWLGLAKPDQTQPYIHHLRSETFPTLKTIPGFIDASILHRPVPRGTEFLIITRWQSLAAIHAFAGADAETAVVPDKVQAMMVEYEAKARHYLVEPD